MKTKTAAFIFLLGFGGYSGFGKVYGASQKMPTFEWKMKTRASQSYRAYLGEDRYSTDYTHPSFWEVDFDACESDVQSPSRATYHWDFVSLEGQGLSKTVQTTDCKLEWKATSSPQLPGICQRFPDSPICDTTGQSVPSSPSFPKLGKYRVSLKIKDGATFTKTKQLTIDLKDYVFLSLGDSQSAGEGIPRSGSKLWWDDECHRSFDSPSAVAARRFDEANDHLSVTFISHACSGAKIRNLYRNAQKPGRYNQIEAANESLCLAGDCRDVDLLLVSAGINDVHFSSMIRECATPNGGESCDSLIAKAYRDLDQIPTSYRELNAAIRSDLEPKKVMIMDYPVNALTDEEGAESCLSVLDDISDEEAQELFELGLALNHQVESVARSYGWHYVAGIGDAFSGHGMCTAKDKRWIVQRDESFEQQGDGDGTVHPNAKGASAIADLMVPELHKSYAPALFADSQNVTIHPKNNNTYCLQKKYNDWRLGNTIHLWNCDAGTNTFKAWKINRNGYIQPLANTSLCWHRKRRDWDLNQPIHLWNCNDGGESQKTWYVDSDGHIRSKMNPFVCIGRDDFNLANGNKLVLKSCGDVKSLWTVKDLL